jgi:5-methyltetrahydrofolate--homocysteine methyltransferase
MKNSIREILNKPLVILDGAMGTMLLKSGVALGKYPEALCFTHADIIENIHKQYVDAGADIIYTNTFGANRKKLAGSGYS